jgi:hypothetical protein
MLDNLNTAEVKSYLVPVHKMKYFLLSFRQAEILMRRHMVDIQRIEIFV